MNAEPAATLILSDVHLRLDCPDRGRRLAHFVRRLDPTTEELIVAGDLCDFWFASRRRDGDERRCPGLSALREFRDRGGRLRILTGNHDTWLAALYRDAIGAEVPESLTLDLVRHGLRLHIAHGHILGVTSGAGWKAAMEGRGFLRLFRAVPTPMAAGFEALLDGTNALTRSMADHALINRFRAYGRTLAATTELLVMGHVHRTVDEESGDGPRLIVLGDWKKQASHLRIDSSGARLVIEADPAAITEPSESRSPTP